MARAWQCGFELQSITAGVEFQTVLGSGVSINTNASFVRSGSASLKIVTSNADTGYLTQIIASSEVPTWTRAYFYFTAWPTDANGAIIQHENSLGTAIACLVITTGGKLRVFDGDSAGTQRGSDSAALNLNQWYMLEFHTQNGGSPEIEGRIDGVAFASGTMTSATDCEFVDVGSEDFMANGVWYVDDIAVNDNSGTNQTSYPGAGQIIHLKPNAAGDNNAFTVQVGGTIGSSNNYTRVNETTPDDATTYNGDVTSGDIDDFNIDNTPASIGASDTINVVMVGVRYRALVAAAEAAFKVRVKKAASGTVASSAAITPNSTTWKTNANATGNWPYPIVEYQNPDAAAWTKALLDTAQIGYTISTTNTNAADISAIWMSVDSTPAAASSYKSRPLALLGVG